ncbi:tape measure protein [Mesorhizobium sp. IMUNJ 23232]|uniref:tape measure protein n=1 Tax=Mesorhizobium sp. IMUNJ 23232 TaxID=3376064 RepID=UPI0037AC1109
MVVSLEARIKSYENSLARAQRQTDQRMKGIENALKRPQAEFQKTADVAARSLAKIERQSATSAAAISASFKAVGAGLGAGLGIQQFTKFADASTRITNGLKVAGVEGKALADTYQRLGKIALDNGASFEAVAGLYGKVTKASKELGISSRDVEEFTRRVAVGLKASGTDAQQASAGIMQLNQALASGVLRGDEFNSVAENLPVVAEAIAKGMGVTVGRLRELAAEGALDARTVFQAFMRGSADLDAQAAKTSTTFSQAFQNIGTALTIAAGKFNETTGASQAFADAVNTFVVPAITSLGEAIATTNERHAALGRQLQDFAQRWGIEQAVLDAVAAFKDLGNVTDPLLVAFEAAQAKVRAARGALKQDFEGVADDFSAAMAELKAAGQDDVASGLAVAFVDLQAKIGAGTAEARDFDSVIAGLVNTGNTMADQVAGKLEIISGKFANAGEAAKKAFDDAGKALATALGENALAVVDALAGRLGDTLPAAVGRFSTALRQALDLLGKMDASSAAVVAQLEASPGFQPGALNTGPAGGFLNFDDGTATPDNDPSKIPLPDQVDVTPERRVDPFLGDAGGRGADKLKQEAQKAADKLNDAIARQTGVAVDAATTLIGQSENANASTINAFLKRGGVDLNAATTAWCAAFVNSALAQVGVKGTGSDVATDFLNWGQAVDLANIQRGDVLVDPNGRRAGQTGGHVGFATGQLRITAEGIQQVEMLSGNASDKVSADWVNASEIVARRATDAFQVPAAALQNLTTQSAEAKAATEAQTAALEAQKAAYDELAGIGVNALGNLATALADGKLEGRELVQILISIAQQLLSMKNIGALFGGATSGGGGGSIIGNIFSAIFGGFGGTADPWQGLRLAEGGRVSGPGGPTGDKIPAMLSDGEHVTNARSAKKYGPLLAAINADRLPHLAAGGDVGTMMSAGERYASRQAERHSASARSGLVGSVARDRPRQAIDINVSGARGNKEITDMVREGVGAAIRENNQKAVPQIAVRSVTEYQRRK